MKKMVLLLFGLLFLMTVAVGCSKEQKEIQTNKAMGVIGEVKETNIVVDDIPIKYSVELKNLESNSNPSPISVLTFPASITKNTVINHVVNNKKTRTDVTALKAGKHAVIVWRFTTARVIEALEIDVM
ncbi:hypothetical protein SAMN05444162_1275 [Paenibacillaceae bacterium GAS479]|nr:hypothetical protein SAMN05444162_1275 [Paenibacillaceae bacterium GAS479]